MGVEDGLQITDFQYLNDRNTLPFYIAPTLRRVPLIFCWWQLSIRVATFQAVDSVPE
jgi:hypothetical protein